MHQLAVIAVTEQGAKLAARLAAAWPHSADVFVKAGRAAGLAVSEFTSLSSLVNDIFSRYEGLVFIMAAGIVVRVIAPLVCDKRSDPAVVVMDDAGCHAISLLSGHLGGANELTRHIATLTGAAPVITTATDLAGVTAPDVIARQLNLRIEPFAQLKTVNAALAHGRRVAYFLDTSLPQAVVIQQQLLADGITAQPLSVATPLADGYAAAVLITAKQVVIPQAAVQLSLRPLQVMAGIGCRRGTSEAEIMTALAAAFQTAGYSQLSLAGIGSTVVKADEAGLLAAAQQLAVPLEFFENAALAACIEQYELSISNFVNEQIGVGNVCEAAALLAAHSSKLILPKTKYGRVTVALAEVN